MFRIKREARTDPIVTQFNPLTPNGRVHSYHLEESIANFRGV